jgi:nucleoside-diphosphate-sugar epimerase
LKILITGAASPLAQEIITALDSAYEVRLLDDCPPIEGQQDADWVQGSLTDPQVAWQAVRNIDLLIHTGEPPPTLATDPGQCEQTLLDLATRGTHVLLKAAIEAGLKRFIYGSTLEIFSGYPDTVYITEMHKPLPTPDMPQMGRYLGELTCREFAREHMVTGTALRLGKLVLKEDVAGQQPDLMWLDRRDAAQAFCAVVAHHTSLSFRWVGRWNLYHICAPITNPKFLIAKAETIGYQPQHAFQADKGLQ